MIILGHLKRNIHVEILVLNSIGVYLEPVKSSKMVINFILMLHEPFSRCALELVNQSEFTLMLLTPEKLQ